MKFQSLVLQTLSQVKIQIATMSTQPCGIITKMLKGETDENVTVM